MHNPNSEAYTTFQDIDNSLARLSQQLQTIVTASDPHSELPKLDRLQVPISQFTEAELMKIFRQLSECISYIQILHSQFEIRFQENPRDFGQKYFRIIILACNLYDLQAQICRQLTQTNYDGYAKNYLESLLLCGDLAHEISSIIKYYQIQIEGLDLQAKKLELNAFDALARNVEDTEIMILGLPVQYWGLIARYRRMELVLNPDLHGENADLSAVSSFYTEEFKQIWSAINDFLPRTQGIPRMKAVLYWIMMKHSVTFGKDISYQNGIKTAALKAFQHVDSRALTPFEMMCYREATNQQS